MWNGFQDLFNVGYLHVIQCLRAMESGERQQIIEKSCRDEESVGLRISKTVSFFPRMANPFSRLFLNFVLFL